MHARAAAWLTHGVDRLLPARLSFAVTIVILVIPGGVCCSACSCRLAAAKPGPAQLLLRRQEQRIQLLFLFLLMLLMTLFLFFWSPFVLRRWHRRPTANASESTLLCCPLKAQRLTRGVWCSTPISRA